jgi:Asp-tRNA(Asn)/Glu-tRNA(Gln) amidotransferase A subunit family amidase
MDTAAFAWLTAADAARRIADRSLDAEQLVSACLQRIREAEPEVQAWAFLDEAHALAQARAADDQRRSGAPLGPLHGVPVGVKDIIDTGDMPTENGSVLHRGRTPRRDAAVVATLRAAGAVILGKTVTTEFAYFAPGKTRNPHNAKHTPGGSSSGSAAAVAAGMVPLALGSQTNGSVIRPASFCGVFGFKPTHGLISRTGVLRLSRTLDHIGLFARSIEDVALLAEVTAGHDEGDPDTRVRARVPYVAIAAEEPPIEPMLAFIKTPLWERVAGDAKEAFAELVKTLGDRVEEVELVPSAEQAWDWHRTIMEAEMAANLEREWLRGQRKLSPQLRGLMERGRQLSALDYQRAIASSALVAESLEELLVERYDAILTPAAPGTAPAGLNSTGDPAFCTLWTLLGMPALTLPLMTGANGLPLGVQLVGRRHCDAQLMRTARWVQQRVQQASAGPAAPAGRAAPRSRRSARRTAPSA